MISYVKGTLTAIEEDRIVVETGGIGYGIRVPLSLLEELPALGTEITVRNGPYSCSDHEVTTGG